MPKLIIVSGMHRSGTSAITGVLEGLGVRLGDDLAKARKGVNEKGYKEDVEAIKIHEDLLWSVPSSWDDIRTLTLADITPETQLSARLAIKQLLERYFADHSLCAIKDPRICLFLPLWIDACEELGIEPLILIPIRHPKGVIQSLSRRDNMYPDRAAMLWLKYFLFSEKHSRNYCRLFITYERLLEKPDQVIDAITNTFAITNEITANSDSAKDFLSQNLNHNNTDKASPENWVYLATEELYLATCTEDFSEKTLIENADKVWLQYTDYLNNSDPILLDQIMSQASHSQEFRRYWQDASHSRTAKLAASLRNILKPILYILPQ